MLRRAQRKSFSESECLGYHPLLMLPCVHSLLVPSVSPFTQAHFISFLPSAQMSKVRRRPSFSPSLLPLTHTTLSPSPLLVFSVPVTLPYFNSSNPRPLGWSQFAEPVQHQHAVSAQIGPPYVYSVDLHGPIQDVFDTIRTAVQTPIDRQ